MNKPITTLVILSIALAITIIALIVIDSRTDELFAQPKPVVFAFTKPFTEPNEPETVDGTTNLFHFEPCTTIAIICEDGNDVIIDFGGDEVVVTGANKEGAKLFFEYVRKYMDAYLESKQ